MKYRKNNFLKGSIISYFIILYIVSILNSINIHADIIDEKSDENFIDIITDNSVNESMIEYFENLMKFSYENKTFFIDIESLSNYVFSKKNKITEVFLVLEDTPKIILKSDKDLLSIKQIEDGQTYLFFGVPNDLKTTDKDLIYIIEDDNKNTLENYQKKISVIIKNNPKIEMNVSNLIIRTNGLKINKNSFDDLNYFTDKEIYLLYEKKLTKIFIYEKLFLINDYFFRYDNNDKKGFVLNDNIQEEFDLYNEFTEVYVESDEKNCEKFKWQIFNEKKFYEDLEKINREGKKIIRIENIDFKDAIENIKNNIDPLYQKDTYFMIFNLPNVETQEKKAIMPDKYNLIINEKNNISVNLIIPNLELGKNETSDEKIRLNAINYYDELFSNPVFFNSIDYLAVPINTTKTDGFRYCVNASRIPFYKNEIYCLDSFYAYRRILERAKEFNEKELKVILFVENTTELDYELLETLKIDPYVDAVFIDKEICS